MAHCKPVKPHLLSEFELRRFQDAADENAKLADCWNSEHVVILSLEWMDAYKVSGYMFMPYLRLNIMAPEPKPTEADGEQGKKKHHNQHQPPRREIYRRSIRMIEEVKITKANRAFVRGPYCDKADGHETSELYSADARRKAQDIFDELAAEHAAICIATYDLRDARRTARALETFGVRLPAKAVTVDLVKVLEHQARAEGGAIPEELRRYTDENVAVRNGRCERTPGNVVGRDGMPHLRMVEVLGPAAERHRWSFRKVEREDAALERISRRMRSTDLKYLIRQRT
ncbi:hypothetical protein CSOJ01_04746 [Colletotrichum sojae]|uniref:Uncharacterized protein n=1 Tax=Colletotrichum sojae TaxID=2175907 RepID=A0A8H6JHL8_9PEZI|nr:hypothetical protein CSOJ01_04746 [Colletotrichum sojae]